MSINPSFPTNPDVIIIGAGAAGLGAARKLMKSGHCVLIVEAANRVGGRAWTQSDTFGIPADMGCSWISGATKNRFTRIARKGGFTLVDHTDRETALFVNGRRATASELAAFYKTGGKVERMFGHGLHGRFGIRRHSVHTRLARGQAGGNCGFAHGFVDQGAVAV